MIHLNHSRNLAKLLPALITTLGLMLATTAPAQIYTNLYTFLGYTNGSMDGSTPYAGLVQGSDGYFYGTTGNGGTNNSGTVFKIGATGTLASLHSFNGTSDGERPWACLVQGSDGSFYGTTVAGGRNQSGTVFKIDGSGTFTNLYSFTGGNDGEFPYGALVRGGDGYFYGTTIHGGTDKNFNGGTVFRISTNGVLASLYSFTGGNDGANPSAGLVQGRDGNFYGTTAVGGANNWGTVFKISAAGALATLHSFTGTNDGEVSRAALVQGSDGYFYGTTVGGGTNNSGTVFKISTNGALTSLYSFTGGKDGWRPLAGLTQARDGNFYGTTQNGGTNNWGTVFRISANGALTTLHAFTDDYYDARPYAGLVQGSDGNLYGTTVGLGSQTSVGNVFRLTILTAPPVLTIVANGTNINLTWPTNEAGLTFTLQSTTNLALPAAWITASPAPLVANGQNTVTNPISGSLKFYRLAE